ncbi:MAG: hypothetical protein U0441_34065 [Polyangiaceae bacterium]
MKRIFDFALRLVFFAVLPFVATLAAAAFPMTGVLVNVVVALLVFAFAEAVRSRAERSRLLRVLVRRHLEFEAYYREHPPGPFIYYIFSPVLFPYWLLSRQARREVLLYRNLTGGGVVILLVGATIDFVRNWRPQLSIQHFLLVWTLLFVVQTMLSLVFVAPIATTVVKYHLERRIVALWVLLAVGAASAGLAVYRLERRKSPVVSWVTTERVMRRTEADPKTAHNVQIEALRAVLANPKELAASTDDRGWVEDDSLERADEILEKLYKQDEAYAFTLHAYPPDAPKVLLLQCHLGWGRPALWRALRTDGVEITRKEDLPPGVLGLQRKNTRRPASHPAPFRSRE